MAIPLSLQLFDSFLGTAEGIHSIILPDIFSSGGSKNVWMDQFARVSRILGYQSQGSPYLTNTGGSACLLRALIPYRLTSGGSVTRRLVGVFDDGVDEWEIAYSDNEGATWTFLADIGATSVGQIPDWDSFGDILLLTDGKTAPRQLSGTTLSTIGGTQLAAPTIAVAGTGNLNGNYKWKIVPIKSDGTRKIASVASASTSLQDESATVTWVADADVNVVGYEAYRTSGTGGIFYFADYIDGRTVVTLTDNLSDLSLVENRALQEHGDAPPTGSRYVVVHKQRAWYLGTDADPQEGAYSDPGMYDSVSPTARMEFKKGETIGDFITGGMGEFEGMLVVFQERSIWTVSGTGQVIGDIEDWTRNRTNAQAGAVSRRSIVRIPAGAKYSDQEGARQVTPTVTLAYLTPYKDIRLFDGDNDIVISHPMKEALAGLNYAQRRKVWALHDTERGEVVWCYPAGTNAENSTAVAWNYRWGVWYEREWPFASLAEVESSSDAAIQLASLTTMPASGNGQSILLWTTNLFNGVAFTAQWMTKAFYGRNEQGQPMPAYIKRWRWLEVVLKAQQDLDLTIEWLSGNAANNASAIGSEIVSPETEALRDSQGALVLTAGGDQIRVSETSVQRKIKLKAAGKYYHDASIRLRIGDVNSQGAWSLEAYTLAYQILPGLARDRGV